MYKARASRSHCYTFFLCWCVKHPSKSRAFPTLEDPVVVFSLFWATPHVGGFRHSLSAG